MLAISADTTAALAPAARRTRGPSAPALCFWVAGILLYGGAALNFAHGHFLDQTSRDLWQHLAALKALIADPIHPVNPFVVTADGSRQFHPYWLSVALVARLFQWNEWQAIAFAGFVSAAVLIAGIWCFARAFFPSPWGPLALLAALVLGWTLPISHTGYHSLETFIEGIAYPAALLIGLSFLLWALVIRGFERPRRMVLIVPLTAFMFATHQLGAGIGVIGAGCFLLFWPGARLRDRILCGAAIGAGLLLALAWPYHSPLDAIRRTGNARWPGGLDFYSMQLMVVALVPSIVGLAGLLHPGFARRARPVLAAFLLFAAIFATGRFGILLATRFVMPAVLMLQIGLAALFLLVAEKWPTLSRPARLGLFAGAMACIQFHAIVVVAQLRSEAAESRTWGNAYEEARALTRDIPDSEPVAAYDVVAWPVVATGQRAVSVPWPEPGIADLDRRQADVERLADPALTRDQRVALLHRWGARTFIIDRRGPLRRAMPPGLLKTLAAQAVRRRDAGPFTRFDFE